MRIVNTQKTENFKPTFSSTTTNPPLCFLFLAFLKSREAVAGANEPWPQADAPHISLSLAAPFPLYTLHFPQLTQHCRCSEAHGALKSSRVDSFFFFFSVTQAGLKWTETEDLRGNTSVSLFSRINQLQLMCVFLIFLFCPSLVTVPFSLKAICQCCVILFEHIKAKWGQMGSLQFIGTHYIINKNIYKKLKGKKEFFSYLMQ